MHRRRHNPFVQPFPGPSSTQDAGDSERPREHRERLPFPQPATTSQQLNRAFRAFINSHQCAARRSRYGAVVGAEPRRSGCGFDVDRSPGAEAGAPAFGECATSFPPVVEASSSFDSHQTSPAIP